jgi:hypothetical protein
MKCLLWNQTRKFVVKQLLVKSVMNLMGPDLFFGHIESAGNGEDMTGKSDIKSIGKTAKNISNFCLIFFFLNCS